MTACALINMRLEVLQKKTIAPLPKTKCNVTKVIVIDGRGILTV